ncbi:MAG: circularly permuted type 2 ATP-grasp protein, partial [Acidimicrobiales bacterium]|nr:circularly permuted type 2 ATP-grasp protein [Acidimicrobiales bacterium]
MTLLTTSDLLARYAPLEGHHDELLDGPGVRPHWREVVGSLTDLGPHELARRASALGRLLLDEGVGYNVTSGERSIPRAWTLDPVPEVVPADEWAALEAGLAQRSELLDRVLADLYGPRRLLADGTIPAEVVYGHPGFLRACDGIRLPGSHQLVHAAFDVGRDADGTWTLISDRTQAPSGAGYARENRVALSRVLPDVYRGLDVVRLGPFFLELRAALERVAPPSADAPRIVVLTPGPRSETAFEHGSLASYLGYPLVQGSDLR